jgi:periplasmic divalent cation tolerance protein
MHETQEIPLIIKTTVTQQERLLERLVALHPYELPEALVVPVAGGLAPYLAWVQGQTTKGLG